MEKKQGGNGTKVFFLSKIEGKRGESERERRKWERKKKVGEKEESGREGKRKWKQTQV